ncbi:hypothetical protein [Actinophytocola sp.]|uniref:hypothetical protein n=1 Tax=Actinophytocola sp. TaxID=1872138 RepID=UPI002ED6BEF3
MDPYSMLQLATTRRDDFVREAAEDRIAREVRENTDVEPRPAPRGAPRLRIAG